MGETKLIAAIESASGVVNALSIATASPRMIAIALAGFDYLVDMQTSRSGRLGAGVVLCACRGTACRACRAHRCLRRRLRRRERRRGFLARGRDRQAAGFNGKSLIHPRQVDLLHRAYAPTQKKLEYAKRVLAAADAAHRNGLGVVSLDGKMIDPPVIHEAEMVLSRSRHRVRQNILEGPI